MLLLLMLNVVNRFCTPKMHFLKQDFLAQKATALLSEWCYACFFMDPEVHSCVFRILKPSVPLKLLLLCHSRKPDIFIRSLNWLICLYLNMIECANNRGNRSYWVQFTTHQRRAFSDTVPFTFLRILLIAPHHLHCWFQPAGFYSVVHNNRNDTECSRPTAVYLIVEDSPLCKM